MSAENETPDLTEEERFAAFSDEQDENKATETPAEPQAKEAVKAPDPKPKAETPAELFPGYSALSEEGRKAVDAAFEERKTLAEKAAQLEQRYRAQNGQLAPTQRKAAELERQYTALLNKLKESEKAAQERANAGNVAAHSKYKELYPDEAAALEAVVNPLQAKIDALTEQLEVVGKKADYAERTQRETMELQRESSAVLKLHPDASEVINDPAFHAWVDALDEDDKQMVASKDARHAIKVLNNFKRDKAYAELLVAQSDPQKPAATPASRKPRLDVEPNPRNRQSPAPRSGNAYGSAEEEAFANYVDAEDARKA